MNAAADTGDARPPDAAGDSNARQYRQYQLVAAELAAALGAQLAAAGARAATVESCTGGGIAAALTAVPGASDWFDYGFVTYSNAAKTAAVGVPAALIREHGAVSAEVASAMAEGGLHRSGADYCVAVTGVAGPGGGTPRHPVGAVYFGWAGRGRATVTARADFDGDRDAIRRQTVVRALAGLRDFIAAAAATTAADTTVTADATATATAPAAPPNGL
ncbi:MAG: CinA family protein [Gammaproteobacteria bacterium]|nr:CinA family protein [Gammaproteobacteria bacterium]